MITVKNVVKSFEGFTALNGLSFNVPAGSIYGLVGPNGAGKSTIIRHITGIYRQDDGEILVDGEPVFENTQIKGRIAYIPDDVFFFASASTDDMMKFYKGIYPRFDMDLYKRLYEAFELDGKRPMRRFSKGQQKQASFRLALSMRPDLLILDEPVDGLDPVMRRQVWSLLMGEVADRGTTVLVSSHNLRELEDVCDHIGIMSRGRLLLERALSDLQSSVVKIQLALPDGGALDTEGLDILHRSSLGRMQSIILRDMENKAEEVLSKSSPLFIDRVPLTLEEIFIYELGGEDYAVKDILI